MIAFIRQYVEKNEKINISVRKIMRVACRKSKIIRLLAQKLPDFAEVDQF